MSDYPPSVAQVNQRAPVPRRIRATLGGLVVVNTTAALYVGQWPHYPQYCIPIADFDAIAGLAGMACFEWDALDDWYEGDEGDEQVSGR